MTGLSRIRFHKLSRQAAKMHAFQSTLWSLISLARKGESGAALHFGRRYRAPVLAYCQRLGLRAEEAEDATQEVMLRFFCRGVIQRADRTRGRFRSLLCAVARNVVRRHWERQRAQKRHGLTESLSNLDVPELVSDDTFDYEWLRHLIDLALLRLSDESPQYYEVLRRFLLEEMSHAHIAEALDISTCSVKNHIYRGKQKLIRLLRDEVRDYCHHWDQYAEELHHLAKVMGTTGSELTASLTVA